jgi:hypothetical protein
MNMSRSYSQQKTLYLSFTTVYAAGTDYKRFHKFTSCFGIYRLYCLVKYLFYLRLL